MVCISITPSDIFFVNKDRVSVQIPFRFYDVPRYEDIITCGIAEPVFDDPLIRVPNSVSFPSHREVENGIRTVWPINIPEDVRPYLTFYYIVGVLRDHPNPRPLLTFNVVFEGPEDLAVMWKLIT